MEVNDPSTPFFFGAILFLPAGRELKYAEQGFFSTFFSP
jgi:hypothetical protein